MSDIGIDLHLMTRGYSRDYRFIGKEQVDRWWMKYSEWTRFEAPTIIVENRRFFVSGIISSRRRDRVGTPIRYTLAGEVPNSVTDSDSRAIQTVINFIARATDALKEKGDFSKLAESFDKIDNDQIENALADDDNAARKVLENIEKQLTGIKKRQQQPVDPGGRWCCGANECGFDHLLVTAESTIRGRGGELAAYLNLAEKEDAQSALSQGREGGIVVEKGPDKPENLPDPADGGRHSKKKLVLLVVLGIAIVAVVLVVKNGKSGTEGPMPGPTISNIPVPVIVDAHLKPSVVVPPPIDVRVLPGANPQTEKLPSKQTQSDTAPEPNARAIDQVGLGENKEPTKQIHSPKESEPAKP